MGLLVELDLPALGYREFLESNGEVVYINYSDALDAFVETFLSIALREVPVRTGYLRSTIDAETDGWMYAYAEATADYAQYVEYGTTYMDAQPYFTPAFEAAWDAFVSLAGEAQDEAQAELEELLMAMQQATMSAFGTTPMGGGPPGAFLAGTVAFVVLFMVLFPVLVNLYGIMDTLASALGGGGGGMPDIIIT